MPRSIIQREKNAEIAEYQTLRLGDAKKVDRLRAELGIVQGE